jgi:DNA-binding response OmpR family regulator
MLPRNCPHCGEKLDDKKIIEWGGWSFDENMNRFAPGTPGASIHLTLLESTVISAILRAGGRPVSKEDYLYSLFCERHPEEKWPDVRIVDVYVSKVRRKLRMANLLMVRTVWGRGYAAVEYTANPVFDNPDKK